MSKLSPWQMVKSDRDHFGDSMYELPSGEVVWPGRTHASWSIAVHILPGRHVVEPYRTIFRDAV